MKFLTIELENIFAYSDRTVFDVSDTTPEKNIVLLWGRNGMGKTSFLSSVKLLFVGANDQKLRTIGLPPRRLGHRQFVLGDGGSWSGLINTRARRLDPEAKARVRIVWEAEGTRISAERQWIATPTGYRETLVVDDGNARLTNDPAEDRLAEFLPRDFVDFFFFDGEDIKAMSESEGRKAIDFDRILRISFITVLATELVQLATERQRAGLPLEVQAEIAKVEGEIGRCRAVQAAAQQQITTLEDQIAFKRSERRQLLTRRDNLRSGASSADREALEARRDELRSLLEEQSADLNTEVPPVAPLLVNPNLLAEALKATNDRIVVAGGPEHALIGRIQKQLPNWLREGPPTVHQRTAEEIAATLSRRLDELVEPTKTGGFFGSLDLTRAARVREILLRYSGTEQRRAHAHMLAAARRTQLELKQVIEALFQIEVGSRATLEEYREIAAALERTDEEISELDRLLGQQQRRREEAESDEKQHAARLQSLERTRALTQQSYLEYLFIQRVARSFNDLREELRQTMREKVQDLINEKFRILVHDHNLVEEIQIDEAYTLTFVDKRGAHVGRSSLSAGLKQLAATALLWAMKEIPGHDIPVVIDTPLGRIDRENQDNMLLNYYPNLAHQVIILPTNAEIDHRKRNLIFEHIAKEYVIRLMHEGPVALYAESRLRQRR